jgi:hypothetical protein
MLLIFTDGPLIVRHIFPLVRVLRLHPSVSLTSHLPSFMTAFCQAQSSARVSIPGHAIGNDRDVQQFGRILVHRYMGIHAHYQRSEPGKPRAHVGHKLEAIYHDDLPLH